LSTIEPPADSLLIDRLLTITLLVVVAVVVGHIYMPDLVQFVQDLTRVYIAPILGLAPAEPYW